MSSRRFLGRPRANGIDAKVKTAISLDSDVAAKLDEEPNKSGLINQLLRKHYSMPEIQGDLFIHWN
ncbi:MAG: hypothetical protein HC820_03135 [Hydrococcus sp. RM1_1_31]|nr:hypothetical protein [Hydrococcus sp. RM1_1_31]